MDELGKIRFYASCIVFSFSIIDACRNLKYLSLKSGLEQPHSYGSWKVREAMPLQRVPMNEMWRLGLLAKLMDMRRTKYMEVKDSQRITAMIDSLCST